MNDHLYGGKGAEVLYADPATVWEADIEPFLECTEARSWVIEEWTSIDPIEHLPTADHIAEYIAEWGADDQGGDVSGDVFDEAMKHADVQRALNLLRHRIARHVTYRNAGELVATHELTLVDGEPHYDGAPLYHKAPR